MVSAANESTSESQQEGQRRRPKIRDVALMAAGMWAASRMALAFFTYATSLLRPGASPAPYLTAPSSELHSATRDVAPPSDLCEATLEEPAFTLVAGQLEGALVRAAGFIPPAKPAQQLGPGGVQVGVAV